MARTPSEVDVQAWPCFESVNNDLVVTFESTTSVVAALLFSYEMTEMFCGLQISPDFLLA